MPIRNGRGGHQIEGDDIPPPGSPYDAESVPKEVAASFFVEDCSGFPWPLLVKGRRCIPKKVPARFFVVDGLPVSAEGPAGEDCSGFPWPLLVKGRRCIPKKVPARFFVVDGLPVSVEGRAGEDVVVVVASCDDDFERGEEEGFLLGNVGIPPPNP